MSVTVIVKDKALDEWLENVALAWRARYPEMAEAYRRLLIENTAAMVNPSGLSGGGTLMYQGEIPQDIFFIIERKMPGFFNDPGKVRKFQQYFMDGFTPERKPKIHIVDRRN